MRLRFWRSITTEDAVCIALAAGYTRISFRSVPEGFTGVCYDSVSGMEIDVTKLRVGWAASGDDGLRITGRDLFHTLKAVQKHIRQ